MAQPEPSYAVDESLGTSLLSRWKRRIDDFYRECYWPGPWTLESDRHDQLIGRDDDIRKLVYLVRDKQVIVLSGDSGVGKSSLLEAGLVPALMRDGYLVLRCDDWKVDQSDDLSNADGLWRYLERKFGAHVQYRGLERDDRRLDEQLNGEYGRKAVLVLDQFEEVIRQQPALFKQLFRLIEDSVQTTRIRIVVSLRAEYVHQLEDLEVKSVSREDQTVGAIRDTRRLRKIVTSGRALNGESAPMITEAAADELVRLWEEADATDRKSNIRLLHLQAVLLALWSSHRTGGTIEREHVAAYIETASAVATWPGSTSVDNQRLAAAVFESALANVVRLHVELCLSELRATRRASADLGLDRDAPLEEGARKILVRLAGFLSSGGYKVDQEELDLLELALSDELGSLGFTAAEVGADSPALGPTYSSGAREIMKNFASLVEAGGDFDWLATSGPDLSARVGVRDGDGQLDDASAGVLLGHSPQRVLVEECRQYFLAIQWLKAGRLIRSSPSDGGKNFLALSHDGFGRGLLEWAQVNRSRPQARLHEVTASFGQTFTWASAQTTDPVRNPLYSEEGPHLVYVNIRWRSCRLLGTPSNNIRLRNLVFMNCDFRGTSFEYCTFQGVSFINCLLDGAQFSGCTILGAVSEVDSELALGTERPLPSFVRQDSDEIVASLQHYRGGDVDDATLIYSATSGVSVQAAVRSGHEERGGKLRGLVRVSRGSSEDLPVTGVAIDERDGLAIVGGRLSSLAFYGCQFPLLVEQDPPTFSSVALRHVAGTSLDFLEHRGGKVVLFDTAIRGFTVSPPITASLPNAAKVELQVEVSDSHLENVWLSAGLVGDFQIARSMIWQLFNGSQRTDAVAGELEPQSPPLNVSLDGDSLFLGIENVPASSVDAAVPLGQHPDYRPQASLWYQPIIARFVERIDYRSYRVQAEFDRAKVERENS